MPSKDQFAIGTFSDREGDEFPGLVVDDRVVDLRAAFGHGMTTRQLLEAWESSFGKLTAIAADSRSDDAQTHAFDDLRPLAPLQPRQILCAGANYYKHVREIVVSAMRLDGDTRPTKELQAFAEEQVKERRLEPYMFCALPSALCGALDDVVLWKPGECHDWELELAVVIGRAGRDIDVSEAMDYVAGYTISNDISVRDVQQRPRFPMTDFLLSKCRPTYFPTGPVIVPRQFVEDPRQLRIQLSVNDELMQDEGVDDIIHPIEELVSYASRTAGIEAGDLILTGSPAGNAGHHGNRWLVPGDVMQGSITGLGIQRNRCVAQPTA